MAVTMNDTYHSLLMDYAAGTLDEAYALVIAAHLALSPEARQTVSQYEKIGGGLLHDCCTPVAMKETALMSVLGRLENCVQEKYERPCTSEEIKCAEMKAMPSCLRAYMKPENDHLPWKKTQPGLRTITVRTTCHQSRAEIMKIDAGISIPKSQPTDYAVTLVLDGIFENGSRSFTRGELVIIDNAIADNHAAGKEAGCLCLAVAKSPCGLSGFLGAALNPFYALFRKL